MCGIFSGISTSIDEDKFNKLKLISKLSESRGKEASGLMFMGLDNQQKTFYSDKKITQLINKNEDHIKAIKNFAFYIGHTNLLHME